MKNTFLAILLSSAVFAGSAAASEIVRWGTGGGWDIMVDRTIGDGCFIQAEYDDGSLVRIGFDPDEGMAFVSAFNDAWGDIEEGATYPIEFDVDGQTYEGEATGLYLADLPGADILFDNVEFFLDLAQRNVLTLYNENGEVMAISLDGTKIGLDGVLQCQEEIDGG